MGRSYLYKLFYSKARPNGLNMTNIYYKQCNMLNVHKAVVEFQLMEENVKVVEFGFAKNIFTDMQIVGKDDDGRR